MCKKTKSIFKFRFARSCRLYRQSETQPKGCVFFVRKKKLQSIFFHQTRTGFPSLTDFFTDSVIAALELIKNKSVEFGGIHPAVFIQHLFIGKHIHDLAKHTEPGI